MNQSEKGRAGRRRWGLAAAASVAALGLILWFLRFGSWSSTGTRDWVDQPAARGPGASAEIGPASKTPRANSGSAAAQARPELPMNGASTSAPMRSRLKLVDLELAPLNGVEVAFYRHQKLADETTPPALVTSDVEGVVPVPDQLTGWNYSLTAEHLVAYPKPGDDSTHVLPAVGGRLRAPLTGELVVVIGTAVLMQLDVRWDDGQVFDGLASMAMYADSTLDVPLRESTPIQVHAGVSSWFPVLEGAWTCFHVLGLSRPGYASRATVSARAAAGSVACITIPASTRPLYGVELDLSSLPQGASVSIAGFDSQGRAIIKARVSQPGIWRCVGLSRPASGVEITVSGQGYCWRSQPVDLAVADPWPRLVVDGRSPGILKCRIVDESGQPVPGAVVVGDTRSRPSSQFAGKDKPTNMGSYCGASRDGLIEFTGLPAGVHQVRVQASGYFSRIIQYNVAPSGTADLGDIVLVKIPDGANTITIRLSEDFDLADSRCWLFYGGGVLSLTPMAFTAGRTATWAGVDYGDYLVAVVSKKSRATLWQARVRLTPEDNKLNLTAERTDPAVVPQPD